MKDNFGVVFELDALLMAKAIIFIKHILIIFSTNMGGGVYLYFFKEILYFISSFVLYCFVFCVIYSGLE